MLEIRLVCILQVHRATDLVLEPVFHVRHIAGELFVELFRRRT